MKDKKYVLYNTIFNKKMFFKKSFFFSKENNTKIFFSFCDLKNKEKERES